MDKLGDLPIDWANVNWPYVIVLVLLVFVCTLIGTSLQHPHSLRHRRRSPRAPLRSLIIR